MLQALLLDPHASTGVSPTLHQHLSEGGRRRTGFGVFSSNLSLMMEKNPLIRLQTKKKLAIVVRSCLHSFIFCYPLRFWAT